MEHEDYTEIKWGVEVTKKLLKRLGNPDTSLKIVHIAGTNGKGSTAQYFTSILISAGKRVGTFTSPKVFNFYDQFKINGKPINGELAEKYFERAKQVSDGLNPSDFEIQTAGCLLAFKEEGCEYAVIECGMGGLNDATNAISKKELAVITSISLEHTAYLGNSIEEICAQKAGIIKNCPVIVNHFQPSEAARNYFKSIGGYFANRITYAGGNIFWYCDKKYELSHSASLQIYNICNAATAIEGAKLLGISDSAIFEGVKNAEVEGRVQKIQAGGRDYILDGAHNPVAFEPLRHFLSNIKGEDITIIFGSLYDKDIEGNLSALSGTTRNIIAVECKSPRKLELDKIKSACERHFKNVSSAQSVSEALNSAYTKTVVVCGSFTLLEEAKQWIDKLTGKGQ